MATPQQRSHGRDDYPDPGPSAAASLRYTHAPTPQLLREFAAALNKNGHLRSRVLASQLRRLPYVQIATDRHGRFVAGCSIKWRAGDAAEIGYMIVERRYRRCGIGAAMTRARIDHARAQGIRMLCAKIRRDNLFSVRNIEKAGFTHAHTSHGQVLANSYIDWYFLPLCTMSQIEYQRLLRQITQAQTPVSADAWLTSSSMRKQARAISIPAR